LTLREIRIAAYNWTELDGMDANDRFLWQGLGYCYEWFRAHPEDRADCDELAKSYIDYWNLRKEK